MPPQRLFLLSKLKKDLAYEVKSFDKVKGQAMLSNRHGRYDNIVLNPAQMKMWYTLTSEEPTFL
jgi:hypothetical protein